MALARLALALLVAAVLLVPCAVAQAHHVAPRAAGDGLWPGRATTDGERLLRAEETATLGVEHAAEHARLRAYQRDPRWRRALGRASVAAARERARLAATGPLDRTGRWPDGGEFDIRTADGTTTFATHAVLLRTGKGALVLDSKPPRSSARPATWRSRCCGTPPRAPARARSSA